MRSNFSKYLLHVRFHPLPPLNVFLIFINAQEKHLKEEEGEKGGVTCFRLRLAQSFVYTNYQVPRKLIVESNAGEINRLVRYGRN